MGIVSRALHQGARRARKQAIRSTYDLWPGPFNPANQRKKAYERKKASSPKVLREKKEVVPWQTKNGYSLEVGDRVHWTYKGNAIYGTVQEKLEDYKVKILRDDGKIAKRQIKGIYAY